VAIALLANTIATGATLTILIFTVGPVSGSHFNPVVTIADASQGGIRRREVTGYIVTQILRVMLGLLAAYIIFGEAMLQLHSISAAGRLAASSVNSSRPTGRPSRSRAR